jgi:hypothetical protein
MSKWSQARFLERCQGKQVTRFCVLGYPTKFPLTQSMSSTGATADGFDRQFGIGRAGDAPRHNVEALCQSIDPGRVDRKIPSGRASDATVCRSPWPLLIGFGDPM